MNPWWNLALEEYLLDGIQQNECILYLWQNQNTIVIGKNQNPWKECRVALLEKEGGKLARRISGGGAVFHDVGNLNFSYLIDREKYHVPTQLGVILSAVRKLGIHAKFSGRNDLTIDGRKFSGNAFCHRKQGSLHHGTILVSVDINKMLRYLQVPQEKIQAKGIDSVRSRVINLAECKPSITIESISEAIIDCFKELYGGNALQLSVDQLDKHAIESLYNKFASWEWRYGETPQFHITINTRFIWGGIEMGFMLEKGIIKKVVVYSDAMDETFIEMLPYVLEGCIFNSRSMAECLCRLDMEDKQRNQMVQDIAQWLLDKNF